MSRRRHEGARPTIHVVPRPQGRWAVKKESKSRASSTHRKKSAAKRKARKMAKKLGRKFGKTQLKIHRRDGKITDSRSYGSKRKKNSW